MGRGGSQSTPRDEPRRMSPSSPPRARRCAGGGGQNVMHPRGGKLGFVTVSLENGQGEKYFIPARETVTNSCGSWGVPPRARRPSFFLGGRFPIFFAFSGSSPFSQNRGENRFERDAPAFSRGRLTCGGLHFFFFFRHFMCTLPSKFILHIWRISRWLKGIVCCIHNKLYNLCV